MDRKSSPLICEILLSFWKIHILHHAREGTVCGLWMIEELRRSAVRDRREYRLSKLGSQALDSILAQLDGLHREVVKRPRRRPERAS